ncbi:MAG TPA: hypothetical protein VEC99_09470 [Clostridia bacterium]|nr:hypothetical protein [Clostridia bacterium]
MQSAPAENTSAAESASQQYPAAPGPARGIGVILALVLVLYYLTTRVETGADEMVSKLGRVEVTARLVERPEQFPQLGAYRYTYVLKYQVLHIHRQDPAGVYRLKPGDEIFVGHYKSWMPRSEIKDSDWGDSPLGGKLDHFVVGEVHRLALDYELQDLSPSGALDYCFPPATNRFFAIWTNPTTY